MKLTRNTANVEGFEQEYGVKIKVYRVEFLHYVVVILHHDQDIAFARRIDWYSELEDAIENTLKDSFQ